MFVIFNKQLTETNECGAKSESESRRQRDALETHILQLYIDTIAQGDVKCCRLFTSNAIEGMYFGESRRRCYFAAENQTTNQ